MSRTEWHDWPGDCTPTKEQADDEWMRARWMRIEQAAREVVAAFTMPTELHADEQKALASLRAALEQK